jgi:hypothetical protein
MKIDPFKILKFTFYSDGWFQSCLVPKSIETCPCCQSQLVAECNGWYKEIIIPKDDWKRIVMMPDEVKVHCLRDYENDLECFIEFEHSDYWRMPYVYWLPVETHCKSWLNDMMRIYFSLDPIPLKWLEANGQGNLFYNQFNEALKPVPPHKRKQSK